MPVIRNGARRSIVRGGRRHCDDQRTEQQRPCTSSRGRRSPGLQSPSIHLDQPQLGMRDMPKRSTPSAHADTDSLEVDYRGGLSRRPGGGPFRGASTPIAGASTRSKNAVPGDRIAPTPRTDPWAQVSQCPAPCSPDAGSPAPSEFASAERTSPACAAEARPSRPSMQACDARTLPAASNDNTRTMVNKRRTKRRYSEPECKSSTSCGSETRCPERLPIAADNDDASMNGLVTDTKRPTRRDGNHPRLKHARRSWTVSRSESLANGPASRR